MSEKYFEKDAFFDVFLHISGFEIFDEMQLEKA
jgi:hypothetical protein